MATKVQIISYAAMLLGKKQTLSLVNQSELIAQLEATFDFLLPSVISKGFWRFATKISVLTQLNITPVGGYYFYAYQLPGDYLEMVHLWPQFYDWEIYNNSQVYTNYNSAAIGSQQLYIEYQYLPEATALPPYFNEYFATHIAAVAALSNAQSVAYHAPLMQESRILWGEAQAKDAQNRPQTPLQNAPMVSRRFVSTFASG